MMIRRAIVDDAEAMCRIYEHHVANGTGSFEENPPDVAEMLSRFSLREEVGFPTLVCENVDGDVVGFAYAGAHKARSAYRFTVEDSVYVEPEYIGQGLGYLLMVQLVELCRELGFRQMMAVIGDSGNAASIALHEKLGFEMIGTAKGIGYKRGQCLDVVYMQLSLVAAAGE